jgi:hypothetical protein
MQPVNTREKHLRHRDGRVLPLGPLPDEEGWMVAIRRPLIMRDGVPVRDDETDTADAVERAWQEMVRDISDGWKQGSTNTSPQTDADQTAVAAYAEYRDYLQTAWRQQ